MGWTTSENLVCILEEGTMVVYDLRGEQVFARVIARVSFINMRLRIYCELIREISIMCLV